MEQKHKDLLMKDLCARLPYNVKCNINFNQKDGTLSTELLQGVMTDSISVKPYLRPMSSMTEEEKKELVDFGLAYWDNGKYTDKDGNTIIYGGKMFQLLPDIETYDWLNRHYFDYRGLIPMGIALEAPADIYELI